MIFQHISTTFCCKDRRTAASFLQQMGVRSKGSAPELLIREVTKVQGAVGFVGGFQGVMGDVWLGMVFVSK